ncbi:hypothetical protein BH11CYA1_BH11CYA1_46710 [soil metagenome]
MTEKTNIVHNPLSQSNAAASNSSLFNLLRHFCGSVVCLTLFALFLVEGVVALARPLTQLNGTGLTSLSQYYVVSKLPQFLNSNSSPNVIMTGSSLFLHPAIRCDDRLNGRLTRYDALYIRDVIDPYISCEYLASLINKTTGKAVKVTNLATAGALFSDQYMVFKKCLAKGKKPEVVVCDISPRSFLDRNQSELEKTPVYLVMANYLSLEDLLEAKASLASIMQSVVGSRWSYLRDRCEYREVFENFACRISNRPGDLFHAQQKGAENSKEEIPIIQPTAKDEAKSGPVYTPKPFDERDLNYYRKVYLPIDWNMYGKEMEFLRLYLAMAEAKKISVVMVQMPIPQANRALLPEDLIEKYTSDVAELAKRYKATLVEPAKSAQYGSSDFEDNAHLNAEGGEKLFKAIEPAISAGLN